MNSVEPPLFQLAMIDFFGAKDPTGERRAECVKWTQRCFTSLEKQLDGREYIACADFTVADLGCQDRPAWERTRRAYEERLHVPRGTVR